MHMEMARTGASAAALGEKMVGRWRSYVAASNYLWRVVGVLKFFAEGYWLDHGRPWDWNQAALAEGKRRADAGIGTYRSN
jgi:hypothetical protein